MAFITPADLVPFATIDPAKAAAMIEDAESMAILAAPCLPGLTTAPGGETPEAAALRLAKLAAVKAILRGAILRWDDAGSGAVQTTQEQTGPFGVQQTIAPQVRKSMFWPSEIESLQGICSSGEKGSAFTLDTAPTGAGGHAPWCDLMFPPGGTTCSCGFALAGYPIYEPVD